MPRHAYFPSRRGDQIAWLKNYRGKIGSYQAAGVYVVADLTATVADADAAVYLLETWHPGVRTFAEAASAYVDTVLYGPLSPTVSPLPSLTFSQPPPNAVAPGALVRIFAFVKNLKTRPFYSETIGQDLGIVGAEAQELETEGMAPTITAARRGEEVRIGWKKGRYEGVEIWVDRGTGTFAKLATDTKPDYFDSEPLPATAQTWRYKARYLLDDAPVGDFSPVVEFLAKA